MVEFVAHPPGSQNPETYRQFEELQRVINELLRRIEALEAAA